ncbi:MAG: hypothetical protein RLZZ69_2991, partial [Cyanobacteriota bacterium]
MQVWSAMGLIGGARLVIKFSSSLFSSCSGRLATEACACIS